MVYRLTHTFRVDAFGRKLPPPPTHGMAAAARYYHARDCTEAERCCLEIIEREPRHFDALHLLGVLSLDQAQLPRAVEYLTRAAAERPADAQVHYHLGTAFLAQKQYEEAEAQFRATLAVVPDHLEALNNMGNALGNQQRHEEAMDCYRRVLAIRPDYPPAHYNMGRSLAGMERLDEAVASFHAALAKGPTATEADKFADVYAGLGQALVGLGRYDEALAACHAMANLNQSLSDWNESLVLLLLGRFAEGWRKYERRWSVADHDPPRAGVQVLDLAHVAGKCILLISEQGRGDIIQFARYAPLLARLGAQVTMQVYVELKPLIETLDGVDGVIAVDEPEPPYDLITPLLSLPLAFGTELSTIPADVPYLRVRSDRLALWQERLGSQRSPRIGIAWSGASEHGGDRSRSIALSRLAPLLRHPGFEFHSVQKDVRAPDWSWLRQHQIVRDHGEALHDFADAAALLSLMDLVIAVDTAAVHLAGALAKPVWIMLPYSADWRWLLDRADSPWYPTARLFRQQRRGDWDGVVADVVRALGEWSGGFQHELEGDADGVVTR
jgi:tetratricopeptide (TPR) repeat protein